MFKLHSFYEDIPEEFFDKTDVDSCFYHKIFDILQSQHRIVRFRRGSHKKSFAIKLFQFCDLKTQQRYILQEEVNIVKKELTRLVGSMRDFLIFLITLANVYRFPYRSPKLRLYLQIQKTISLHITTAKSLNIQIDQFVYRFILETTVLVFFQWKSLNYTAIILFLQKLSTLTFAKFTTSTRTDITLQTSVN